MKRKVFLTICMLSVAMLTACGGGETTPTEEVQEEAVVEVTEESTEEEVAAEEETTVEEESVVEEPVVEEEPVEEEPAVEPAYAVTDEIAFELYDVANYEKTVSLKVLSDFTVDTIVDRLSEDERPVLLTSDGIQFDYKVNYLGTKEYYEESGFTVEETVLTNADGEEIIFHYREIMGSVSQAFMKDIGDSYMIEISTESPERINPEDWVELTRDCYFVISE